MHWPINIDGNLELRADGLRGDASVCALAFLTLLLTSP